MSDIYLVQRLKPGHGHRRGFDGLFECDYMGRAEYELGQVPDSLKAIRAGGQLAKRETTVTTAGVDATVFLVGPAAQLDVAHDRFRLWIAGGCSSLEPTWFPEQLSGTAADWQQSVVAWWALDAHFAWTLDPAVADTLLTAFTPAGQPVAS